MRVTIFVNNPNTAELQRAINTMPGVVSAKFAERIVENKTSTKDSKLSVENKTDTPHRSITIIDLDTEETLFVFTSSVAGILPNIEHIIVDGESIYPTSEPASVI